MTIGQYLIVAVALFTVIVSWPKPRVHHHWISNKLFKRRLRRAHRNSGQCEHQRAARTGRVDAIPSPDRVGVEAPPPAGSAGVVDAHARRATPTAPVGTQSQITPESGVAGGHIGTPAACPPAHTSAGAGLTDPQQSPALAGLDPRRPT